MHKESTANESRARDGETALFTFVVVTDSHIKLEKGDESSPYKANQLANSRSRYVVQQINELSPDFVIHLGDFVQPVPSLPTYAPSMEITKEIFGKLNHKLYSIPGNHDIGDKPVSWMPGPKVSTEGIELYEKFWGKSFSSFDYQDVHFVLINSPVLNSCLPFEEEQKIWLEQDLVKNEGKRIFLFTHYPLYLGFAEEEDHYDNIGEPARSWLLSLIKRYNIEAVYAGHVHHFFFNNYGKTNQYVLPSVTFVRHDYSELFQIEPDANSEGGRNDVDKMGFFLVKVYKDKHVNQLIRTHGRTDDECIGDGIIQRRKVTYQMEGNNQNSIGVYLRHAWAERHVLPYANLDEFGRKIVRNDYPLMALWDLGIKKLRIPYSDLMDDSIRDRIKTLKLLGHEFTVFTVGVPNENIKRNLIYFQELIDAWELVMTEEEIVEVIESIEEVKKEAKIRTHISKIETSAGSKSGTRFYHFIRHGFKATERNLIAGYLTGTKARKVIDGFVFRVDHNDSAVHEIEQISNLANELDISASVHVQMQGSDNLAFAYEDDQAIANKVAEVVASVLPNKNIEVFFDTFIDHDRGYFRRNGLLDRRYNPRLAYYVLKNLLCLLGTNQTYKIICHSNATTILESSDQMNILVIPIEKHNSMHSVTIPQTTTLLINEAGTGNWINLETGEMEKMPWNAEQTADGLKIVFNQAQAYSSPMLFSLTTKTADSAIDFVQRK